MATKYWVTTLILTIYIVEGYNISDYRLPNYAYPTHYALELDLRYPEANAFRAQSWIDVNFTEPDTYELVLNVHPQYVNLSSMIVEVDTATFMCKLADSSNKTQLMALQCIYDFFGNYTDTSSVIMKYNASFSEEPFGLYKNEFTINDTNNYAIFTQFESTGFRRVFPSFDEPAFKAPMDVFVDHYPNLTVVSNMDISESHSTYSSFQTTPLMSTYLLALVAGPNDTWGIYPSSGQHAYNFSIFAQRIYKDHISKALDNGPKLIDLMGTWTDLPYETLGNTKMTFAALPGMGGAMENWGLITFSEKFLIDEGEKTPRKAEDYALSAIAHELAHQWFGDYVTLNWWSEVWLNEGFATYFQWHLLDILSENAEFDLLFLLESFQPALLYDGPKSLPLSRADANVNSEEEIDAGFDPIVSYNKGASIIRMISKTMGEDVFKQGIRSYLKAKGLANAKSSDLIEHLQAVLPKDTKINLTNYLDAWIHEPGYPILKTSLSDTGNGTYLVSVDFYKYRNKTDEKSIWWVPVTYATSDAPFWDKATTSWVSPGETFEYNISNSSDSWSVINVNATGFYRVDYDLDSLARILKVLNNSETYKQIPVLSRAQILDDLFNIAKFYTEEDEGANDRPYMNAFAASQYLRHEDEYHPWFTYLKEVQYLLDEIVENDVTERTLEADALELIEAQLVIPNDSNSMNLTHSEILKRNLLLDWACKLGNKEAIQYVTEQFASYKKGTSSIDNEYRDVILCYGIRHSDDPTGDYSAMTKLYTATIIPQQMYIATGLACLDDTQLLTSYLNSTLGENPTIQKQFWADIFKALFTRSAKGLDVAVRFVAENIEALNQKWKGAMKIEKMITSIASKIVKQKHITLLVGILNEVGLGSDIGNAVMKALIQIEANLEWIEQSDNISY